MSIEFGGSEMCVCVFSFFLFFFLVLYLLSAPWNHRLLMVWARATAQAFSVFLLLFVVIVVC